MTATSFFLGLGAGAVSALLFASAATGTLIGVLVLFLLSPLPVAITGLGWGSGAAAVSAVTAAIALAVTGTPMAGLMHVLAIGLPTVVLSYLVLLNREIGDGPGSVLATQWYPLGRVLGYAAIWAGIMALLALLSVAADLDGLRAVMRRNAELFVKLAARGAPEAPPFGDSDIAAWGELMTLTFAASVGSMWMVLSSLNLWLAGRITRASGRLVRPWPDLALVRLAPFSQHGLIIAVLGGVVFSIAGQGYLALVASGFAAAFLFACMLVGLGIIHYHSRGWQLRALVLGATYAGLLFVYPWGQLAVAMLAVGEGLMPARRPPEDQPPPASPARPNDNSTRD